MRLLPRSLFGRLVLILVVGLLLTQFLSTGLLLKDRIDVIRENTGIQLVQRIASLVYLLEETPATERARIVRAFSTSQFRVTLSDQPLPRGSEAIPSNHLEMMLRQALSENTPIQVAINPLPNGDETERSRWRQHREAVAERRFVEPRTYRSRPPRNGFQASIRLADGSWLNILRPLPEGMENWPYKLLTYLAVLLVSIILLSLLAVRWVTRPLGTLAEAARNLGKDIGYPPLSESGPQEVQNAVRAFNTMQQRLRRYIEDRSRVLAAVSHDLKTPITRLRLRLALLKDDALQSRFNQDLDEMEQMVLATLDYLRGTESKEKPVPISINGLLESLQDDAQELGWEMTLASGKVAPYSGRPLALKRCLMNLIENAVRYGQAADVRLEDYRERLDIIISDRGEGVPEAELEGLFDPFYRREESRARATGGTGLGLGIARNIARAHGGDVTLRRGKTQGLEAVVSLPR
ncbi:ATP-binding protein [Sedimenticola hydrogenitrophicus]|uniref:ATP-binding protein n=1 Tax=Sedimenticola hydrogenitrophicus TaxID=2967975 RepID=UPI0023B0D071|nr:ATP-binding protein [Sedimenticola hydrogenitrophicus]